MKILTCIEERFSPMQFLPDKAIDAEERAMIFEAARWAPSSFNDQPWSYIWAEKSDHEGFGRILSVMDEYNQQWASGASVLVVAVAAEKYRQTGKVNPFAWYETGMSVTQMVIQASALGIQVHQMGGFDPALARDTLNIPVGYNPVVIIALGYADLPERTREPFHKRATTPRIRRETDSFVFRNTFSAG